MVHMKILHTPTSICSMYWFLWSVERLQGRLVLVKSYKNTLFLVLYLIFMGGWVTRLIWGWVGGWNIGWMDGRNTSCASSYKTCKDHDINSILSKKEHILKVRLLGIFNPYRHTTVGFRFLQLLSIFLTSFTKTLLVKLC